VWPLAPPHAKTVRGARVKNVDEIRLEVVRWTLLVVGRKDLRPSITYTRRSAARLTALLGELTDSIVANNR
jgi:hypothetical protein